MHYQSLAVNKRTYRDILRSLLLGASLLFVSNVWASNHNHIKIGVLAFRGADVALKRWTPLAQYLHRQIPGYQFSIVPLDLAETRDAVQKKEIHFILTNPGNYVDLEVSYGISAIATMKKVNNDRQLARFGAVIFTRAGRSDIKSLRDLRGKRFMAVKKNGFGGFQMGWRELKANGIDPFVAFEQLSFSGFPQDAVVFAVRDGLVDAGTLRTGTLEKMQAEGLIRLRDFEVLNQKHVDGFPFALSTDLYPEWPFSRLESTPDELVQRVSLALLKMKMPFAFGKSLGWLEWTSPVSYHTVHQMMQELRVRPYENGAQFSLLEVIRQYMAWVIALLILVIFTAIFLVRIMFLNNKQKSINRELERQFEERIILEKSLEQERNFLNSILDNIRDGIVVCDEQGKLTLFNHAAYAMHGIPREKSTAGEWESYYQLLYTDGDAPIQRNETPLMRALNGEIFKDMELVIAPHQGQRKNVLASGQPIMEEDGSIRGAVVSLFDDTQRMDAERRIFESEKELRSILENMQDTFYRVDMQGRIMRVTPSVENMLGYMPGEVLGKRVQDYYVYEQEWMDYRSALTEQGGKIQDYRVRLKHKNGNEIWLSINAQYYRDADGNVEGVDGIARNITGALEKERQLARSEKELRTIMENMQDTFYRTDTEGRLLRVSPSVLNLLGYEPNEIVGTNLADYYVEKGAREKFLQEFTSHGGKIQNYQACMRRRDGSIVWVSTNSQYYTDKDGNILGIEGTTRDITELKKVEASLHQEKERAQITLQSIGDGVVTTNIYGEIQYINPYAEQMMGVSVGDAGGKRIGNILSFVDAATQLSHGDPVTECLRRNEVLMYSDHMHAIREDGVKFAVKLTVAPMRDQEKTVIGVVLVMHDVSEMWEMARQLSYQAAHDALTGLINRREFERRLDQALETARQEGVTNILCYMDLDQFKIVNDTCGHTAGDMLLKQLAQILKTVVRENDTFARLGGDEFGLLLEGCSIDKAGDIAEKIRQTIKEFRFSWEDKYFEVGVSIGIVPITQHSISIAEILSEADAACYVAKDLGRNRVHRYESGDADLVRHHAEMQWVQRIREAIEEDRFLIYCQRIYPMRGEDERIYSEVLLRMLGEDGEIILPGAFIPAAERYHLMPEIDRWVISNVFQAMQYQGASEQIHTCAINLSGQSVGDESILQFIFDQIDYHCLEPSRICFEITETAAVANLDSARRFIDKLHEIGCQFALDDFGSGVSSFAYLKNLNVDYLKIDGSFVRDISIDPVDYAMVSSINQIGHLMGIKTIAEFVENDDILARLHQIGVDYAQGYALERPAPFESLLPEKLKLV